MQTRAKALTETEKMAWAAGFIDGEGYVGIDRQIYGEPEHARHGRGTHFRATIKVGQVSRVPLDFLQELLGGSVRRHKDKFGHHYTWVVYCEKAIRVAERIAPYTVAKRPQVDLVLRFADAKKQSDRDGLTGRFLRVPEEIFRFRAALHAASIELNRRRNHADRLSEEAPTGKPEGGAIVGSHGNANHESCPEMCNRLLQ